MDTYEIECTECGWQGYAMDLLCEDNLPEGVELKFNICPDCANKDCFEDIDEEEDF